MVYVLRCLLAYNVTMDLCDWFGVSPWPAWWLAVGMMTVVTFIDYRPTRSTKAGDAA